MMFESKRLLSKLIDRYIDIAFIVTFFHLIHDNQNQQKVRFSMRQLEGIKASSYVQQR